MTEQVAGTTSLRFALVLFVVLPLSLLLIIGAYSVLRVVESQAEQRMKDDVELVARTLQQPLSRALERGPLENSGGGARLCVPDSARLQCPCLRWGRPHGGPYRAAGAVCR